MNKEINIHIKTQAEIEKIGIIVLLKHAVISADSIKMSKEDFYLCVDNAWNNKCCSDSNCSLCNHSQ